MPSKGTWLAIAATVAVGMVAGGLVLMSSSMSSSSAGSSGVKRSGVKKAGKKAKVKVTLDKLILMFNEIIKNMKQVQVKLNQIRGQIENDMRSKGKPINPQELDQMLSQQFAEAMKGIETQIYKKHEVEQKDVEKATNQHQNDEKYKAKVEELQNLFDSIQSSQQGMPFSADQWAEVKGKISRDMVVAAVTESMKAINDYVQKELVPQTKLKLPDVNPQDPRFQQAFFKEYQQNAPLRQQIVLDKYFKAFAAEMGEGVTSLQVFQQAVQEYQADPAFQAAMAKAEAENKKQAGVQ